MKKEFRILNRETNKYIEQIFNKYTEALAFIKTLDKPGMHEVYKPNGIKAIYKYEIAPEVFDTLEDKLKDLPMIRIDDEKMDAQGIQIYNGDVWLNIWAPEYFGTLTNELQIDVIIKPNKEYGSSLTVAKINYHNMDNLIETIRNYKHFGGIEPLKFKDIKKPEQPFFKKRFYNF